MVGSKNAPAPAQCDGNTASWVPAAVCRLVDRTRDRPLFSNAGNRWTADGPHWEELKKTTRFEAVRLPMIGPHFELIGELGETMRYFVPKNKQAHLDPMARLFKAICGPSRARTNDIFISSQIRGAQQIAVAEASGYAQRVNIGEQFAGAGGPGLRDQNLRWRGCARVCIRCMRTPLLLWHWGGPPGHR